jgi:hypothetical protein
LVVIKEQVKSLKGSLKKLGNNPLL